jgi:hypothetical protein
MLKLDPLHTEPPVAEMVGDAITTTVLTAGVDVLEIQPTELVPVTE